MTATPTPEFIEIFADLAKMTAPKCGQCRCPHYCCNAEQCEMTRTFALETFGVELKATGNKIPFLGPNGCTVAPHLRPTCSVHVCDQHFADQEWADAYFQKREAAEDILWDVLEDAKTQAT